MIARLGGRRLVLFAALAVAGMLAGALTALQIRAAQAQDHREDAARVAQQEAADAEARLAAERRELVEDWSAAVRVAEGALTDAEVALAASEGAVADDAVRVALADSVAEVLAAVASPGPTPDDLSDLRAATARLTAAKAAAESAVAEWQAAQEAAAAQLPAPTPAPARSSGAGPDCGGPESYEPPRGTGAEYFTSTPSESGDGTNGRIPRSQLTALSWCVDSQGNSQWLRPDAAQALTQMNEAFRERFGENIAVDMTYRSYEDQVALREGLGSIAARPGTSNHGLGTAFDTWEWQAYSFGSERYEWLVSNGPTYGWIAPDWARQNGANPEYWHFEYIG